MKKPVQTACVILHNVRSAANVGSILRTCDAAGVSKIFLTGYTPAPLDRFGRERRDLTKASLGAERTVSWEKKRDAGALIERLAREGMYVVGVEQGSGSHDYRTLTPSYPVAFVFGNEVRGLSKELRAFSDVLIEIPMRGAVVRQAHHPRHTGRGKESLNVSVAAGIVLFSA